MHRPTLFEIQCGKYNVGYFKSASNTSKHQCLQDPSFQRLLVFTKTRAKDDKT